MSNSRWRRWRPQVETQTHQLVDTRPQDAWEVFDSVAARVRRVTITKRFWKQGSQYPEQLNGLITEAQRHAVQSVERGASQFEVAEAWLYALVLQAPRAALAQAQMNKHSHGYHDRKARLFELIDFNDAFVATVLALPEELRPVFLEYAKRLMDQMCKKTGTRCFSDEEFEAISHGLSREIAVFLGVKKEGYEAEMTNRATDAFGIDMRIIDPHAMKAVNVDVKTRSAFYYRIHDLKREGRITDDQMIVADRNGFVAVYNGRGDEQRKVVVWRIDHELLGDIVDFRFKDTRALGEMFAKIVLYTGEPL